MGNLDFSVVLDSAPYLLGTGLQFSIMLTLVSGAFGLLFGAVLAVMRLSPFAWLSVPAGAYVNTMRSIPLLLVIFWFYFLVPYIGAWVLGAPRPVQVGAVNSAIITFSLFEAAYFCEILRAGIQSIPRGQLNAGMALGLGPWQNLRFVVLPQALRNMTPALLTRMIILFQDTSLVYVLSLTDFLGAAAKVGQRDGRLAEMYLFVAAVYFVICFIASRLVKHLERRTRMAR